MAKTMEEKAARSAEKLLAERDKKVETLEALAARV